MFKSVKR